MTRAIDTKQTITEDPALSREVTGTPVGTTKRAADTSSLANFHSALVEVTVETSAYAVADHIGISEIPNAVSRANGTGILQGIEILVRATSNPEMEIAFFSQEPTMISAVNATQEITIADMDFHLGSFIVRQGAYLFTSVDGGTTNDATTATLTQLGWPVAATNSGTSLWAVFRALSAVTFSATNDLAIKPLIIQT